MKQTKMMCISFLAIALASMSINLGAMEQGLNEFEQNVQVKLNIVTAGDEKFEPDVVDSAYNELADAIRDTEKNAASFIEEKLGKEKFTTFVQEISQRHPDLVSPQESTEQHKEEVNVDYLALNENKVGHGYASGDDSEAKSTPKSEQSDLINFEDVSPNNASPDVYTPNASPSDLPTPVDEKRLQEIDQETQIKSTLSDVARMAHEKYEHNKEQPKFVFIDMDMQKDVQKRTDEAEKFISEFYAKKEAAQAKALAKAEEKATLEHLQQEEARAAKEKEIIEKMQQEHDAEEKLEAEKETLRKAAESAPRENPKISLYGGAAEVTQEEFNAAQQNMVTKGETQTPAPAKLSWWPDKFKQLFASPSVPPAVQPVALATKDIVLEKETTPLLSQQKEQDSYMSRAWKTISSPFNSKPVVPKEEGKVLGEKQEQSKTVVVNGQPVQTPVSVRGSGVKPSQDEAQDAEEVKDKDTHKQVPAGVAKGTLKKVAGGAAVVAAGIGGVFVIKNSIPTSSGNIKEDRKSVIVDYLKNGDYVSALQALRDSADHHWTAADIRQLKRMVQAGINKQKRLQGSIASDEVFYQNRERLTQATAGSASATAVSGLLWAAYKKSRGAKLATLGSGMATVLIGSAAGYAWFEKYKHDAAPENQDCLAEILALLEQLATMPVN